jgi:hypothetical protein
LLSQYAAQVFFNYFGTVPVALIVIGITFVFTPHALYFCCKIFSAFLSITYQSPEIVIYTNIHVPLLSSVDDDVQFIAKDGSVG